MKEYAGPRGAPDSAARQVRVAALKALFGSCKAAAAVMGEELGLSKLATEEYAYSLFCDQMLREVRERRSLAPRPNGKWGA